MNESHQPEFPRNRSMPPGVVIPVLAYPDVREAAAWLCRAFGFVERLRIGDHRIQLSLGAGSVVVTGLRAEGGVPDEASHSVMVRVRDAHGHCARAREVGAAILSEPRTIPLEKGSTARRIPEGTGGRSPRPSRTWTRRTGAASGSDRQEFHATDP